MQPYIYIYIGNNAESDMRWVAAQTKLHKHTTPDTILLYVFLYTTTNRLHVIICNDNRNNDFCAFWIDNSGRPGALYRDFRQFSRLPNYMRINIIYTCKINKCIYNTSTKCLECTFYIIYGRVSSINRSEAGRWSLFVYRPLPPPPQPPAECADTRRDTTNIILILS